MISNWIIAKLRNTEKFKNTFIDALVSTYGNQYSKLHVFSPSDDNCEWNYNPHLPHHYVYGKSFLFTR